MKYFKGANQTNWTFIDKINTLSICLLIIYFSLPIMNSFSPIIRAGYTVICITIFYLTVFLKSRKKFAEIILVSVIIFIFNIFSYISQWSDKVDFLQQMYFMFLFWVPFVIMIYIIDIKSIKIYKIITNTIVLSFTITSLTTIIGLTLYPMASRFLATGQTELFNLNQYYRMNIGGYGFIYALVITLPIMYYMLYINKRFRIMYYLIIFIYFICIMKSQYTIAIILSVMALILIYLKRINLTRILIIFLLPLIIFYIFNMNSINQSISQGFLSIANTANDYGLGMISNRLQEIAYALSSQTGLENIVRIQQYGKSTQAFMHNPIFGTLINKYSQYMPGDHSSILDTLGYLGIFGIGFIIYLGFLYYKKLKRNFNNKKIFPFVKLAILLSVIISTINTVFSSIQISLVLFIFTYSASYVEYETQKKYIKYKEVHARRLEGES